MFADPFSEKFNSLAGRRLQAVGDVFKSSLGERIQNINHEKLSLLLELKKTDYVSELELKYNLQNRFFSRIYDLSIQSDLPFRCGEESHIKLLYRGFHNIKDTHFVDESGSEMGKRIADKLNNPRVSKKFLEFQFTGLDIGYQADQNRWSIEARSIVGSSTWMFLPPVFHTIKPKPKECHRIVDLFELLAFVVSTELTI